MKKFLCVLLILSGCAGAPTIKYCETIKYVRDGSKVHVEAECRVPMDDGDNTDTIRTLIEGLMGAMMFM